MTIEPSTGLVMMLGTFEIVVNKSKYRYSHMFPSTFISMSFSTIPVSIIGTRFAMSLERFWAPEQYIPILGMLSGSAISGVVVAISYVMKELQSVLAVWWLSWWSTF